MKKFYFSVFVVISSLILSACGEPKEIKGTVISVDKCGGSFWLSFYGVPRSGYLTNVDMDGNGNFVLLHSLENIFNKGDIINVRVEKKLFEGKIMNPVKQEKTPIVAYSFDKYDFIHDEPLSTEESIKRNIKDKISNAFK